jgi:hypothetical protein
LVLPKEAKAQMDSLDLVDFFQGTGIEVIYGEKDKFIPSSGRAFSEVVTRCVKEYRDARRPPGESAK